MRRLSLHALQTRALTPRTTDSTHGLRCAPNQLLNQPKPTQANRVWVGDITYLPLANDDWTYLCAYQDTVSKQVMGWHVMASMPEELITTALQRAFWAIHPPQDYSSTPTAVVPGRATAMTTCRARASGHASKRRCSNYASGPFLPT